MKILLILPDGLDETIMAKPAIKDLYIKYPDAKITIVGSIENLDMLNSYPKVVSTHIYKIKEGWNHLKAIKEFAKTLGQFDISISFKNDKYSSYLLLVTPAYTKISTKSWHASLLLDKTIKYSKEELLTIHYKNLVAKNHLSE